MAVQCCGAVRLSWTESGLSSSVLSFFLSNSIAVVNPFSRPNTLIIVPNEEFSFGS